eukprot:1141038-Pelagomonas_calceolata.AAC.2
MMNKSQKGSIPEQESGIVDVRYALCQEFSWDSVSYRNNTKPRFSQVTQTTGPLRHCFSFLLPYFKA